MRHLIEKVIPGIDNQRIVAVLGSGPLFDVPLEALSHHFDTVMLVDIAHLLPARLAAKRLGNVELVWADLSNEASPDPLAFLRGLADLDWVISVNLASQLGVNASEGRERAVVDDHLDSLLTLPCAVSLATDLHYKITDAHHGLVEDFDLLHGRPMPKAHDRWTWEVAPFGEESRTTRRTHSMAFYPDWKEASKGEMPPPIS